MREQYKRALQLFLIPLVLGFAYLFLYTVLGLRIPCPINTLTGLYCPGCGVSRMCVALVHLDFVTAFRSNPGVMVLAPLAAVALLPSAISYIRIGVRKNWKGEQILLWLLVILLVIYAVLRNVPAFSFLQPQT